MGHIRPSTSAAAASFFFLQKKDGRLHPCIDYWGLNALNVQNPYPIPFEQLRKARYLMKLDLCSTYNLVRLQEEDEWKTAFHMMREHYKYVVMPFVLTNAPAVFQAFINDIFKDLMGIYR